MHVFDKEVAMIDKVSRCGGSCGVCKECVRKASIAVAKYTMERCALRRGHGNSMSATQKRYLRNQILFLLAALGITDGEEASRSVARSEWGMAMRDRQKR